MLDQADAYLDGAPRPDADAVSAGGFTLFVSRTPWSYYARPARPPSRALARSDLLILAETCARYEVELSIEWVADLHPEVEELCVAAAMEVTSHELMVATPAEVGAAPGTPAAGNGVEVKVVEPDSPLLLECRAVADVSFAHGGTGVGSPGVAEREAARAALSPALVEHLQYRARSGLTVTAVAEAPDAGVVGVASYQPIGPWAELVGVATLPMARRRGIAAALTWALAAHARSSGIEQLVLSAEDEAVADVYRRTGFATIGTAMAAASRAAGVVSAAT